MAEVIAEIDVCTDCTMLIANGETPPEMSEVETEDYRNRITEHCKRWLNGNDHAAIASDGPSHDFSSSACGYCGSRLAGTRYGAVIFG